MHRITSMSVGKVLDWLHFWSGWGRPSAYNNGGHSIVVSPAPLFATVLLPFPGRAVL
jgi:hypothetical protein